MDLRVRVSSQPPCIQANPCLSGYWSVAACAANSDNFLVVNDRQLARQPLVGTLPAG